jgi:peptidyl-Asp metalloendopeptidase
MSVVFFAALIFIAIPAAAQGPARLFTLIETPQIADQKSSVASVREAQVQPGVEDFVSEAASVLEIPVFDNKIFRANRRHQEMRAMDDQTWMGDIVEGDFRGDVIITRRKGHMSALIYTPDAVYEIIPRGETHVLMEIDHSKFPECGGEITPPESELRTSQLAMPSDLLSNVDSGDRIDVLIVYTTATKNFLGGAAQAESFAQQAIAATNAAYINSRIRQRVRMVHAAEYAFTETGNSSSDLSTLRQNTAVQTLRNTHKADLVAMIGEVTDVCGIGYLVGDAGGSEWGYSITARVCAVGNITLGHEMGHNMGSQHNPENSGSSPSFPFSYGHYVNGSFRTVMSYVDQCSSGCARRPYFSNPLVNFNGAPTGISGQRDNARSLDLTGDVMANYRYSGSSLRLTNFRQDGALPRGIRRDVTWASNGVSGDVRIDYSTDGGANWRTLVAATPNTGSASVTLNGRVAKRLRLRIASLTDPAVSDSSVANLTLR